VQSWLSATPENRAPWVGCAVQGVQLIKRQAQPWLEPSGSVRAFGVSRHALASCSVALRFRASALLAEHTPGARTRIKRQRGEQVLGAHLAAPGLLGNRGPPRAVHDPGKIVADLVLALGGDCLADVTMLRAQPQLFGPAASDPVVSRLVSRLADDLPAALRAIRTARAAACQRVWALARRIAPGAGGGLVPLDVDATIVASCSEKEQAAPPADGGR
jgi:hypothetical protein